MRTRSLLCVHKNSTEVEHTDNESAQHFGLGKTLRKFSCAPDGVRTSGLLDLESVDTLPIDVVNLV